MSVFVFFFGNERALRAEHAHECNKQSLWRFGISRRLEHDTPRRVCVDYIFDDDSLSWT